MISLKYRIYPNKEQQSKLEATLTTCRYLYNNALAERIDRYKTDKVSVSYVDQANHLSKNKNEYQKNVHSQVLQDTLKRLDKSFKRFFDGLKKGVRVGFPRFKADNRFRSFCYPQSGFRVVNNGTHIRLSKIGDVKLRLSKPVEGKVKTCIVVKDVDQWFVVLTCEHEQQKDVQTAKPSVGIDVGVEKLATLSDGSIVENPRTLVKTQAKMAKAQRSLSKKKKASNNRAKQRIKVAKLHRKIRRQRDDFLHKTSTYLAEKYGTIVFEDLNVKGMLKNHCLAKHISDASWNKLIQLTTYKAESAGGRVVKVDVKNTSQNGSG
jgi:putative transposase